MQSSTAINPSSPKLSESARSVAIRCERVAKRFYHYTHRTTSLREVFIRVAKRRPIHERTAEFSLEDFSLEIAHGESVGLIGRNGSGKSTALRLIAGIYAPSEGMIETRGRLTTVIELGAGFNRDLTGAENVALYGAVMGLNREQVRERFQEIVHFADIGPFINEPVKYYSSGMQARLAFAVAICVHPDILLVDEVLAVGDEAFRARCLDRIREFLRDGGTMVVVTHDLNMLQTLCPRAIWLDDGRIRMDDSVPNVIAAYKAELTEDVPRPSPIPPPKPAADVNFALVVGAQRSGTTWLQMLCAANPKVSGGEESQLFSLYLGNLTQMYYTHLAQDDPTVRPSGLAAFLTIAEFNDMYRQFALAVMKKILDAKQGARLVVEKTPDHTLHLRYLRWVFPKMKVVHIIRDGRDVVVSQIAASKTSWGESWAPTSAADAAKRWVKWVQRGRELATDPELYHELRYEQLLSNGVETLSAVYEFLGVPMPREQVKTIYDQFSLSDCIEGKAPYVFIRCGEPKQMIAADTSRKFFRKGVAGGWKRALSPEQAAEAEHVAAPLLKELGYLQS